MPDLHLMRGSQSTDNSRNSCKSKINSNNVRMNKDIGFNQNINPNLYFIKGNDSSSSSSSDEEVTFKVTLEPNEISKGEADRIFKRPGLSVLTTTCYVDVSFNKSMNDHLVIAKKSNNVNGGSINNNNDSDADQTDGDDEDDGDDVVFHTGPTFQDTQDDTAIEEPDDIVIQTIGCIGQGLTSTVYSAHILNNTGKKLKGTVAVKVFNRNTAYSVVSGEVRLLRRLDHSNIITFLGYLVTPITVASPSANKATRKPKQNRSKKSSNKILPDSKSPPPPQTLQPPQTPPQSSPSQPRNNTKPKPESSAFTQGTESQQITNNITCPGPVIHQLVMEHCSRGNLFDLLHQPRGETKVPLSDIARKYRAKVILGVATGMAYLHKYGIVHRDLSSKNILLTQNWEPKIADFGQAKQVPCSLDPKTGKKVFDGVLTGPGGFGTDPWRAPEVWRRPRGQSVQYSLPIDVYSYGIILWELYHLGHVPWATTLDIEDAIKRGKRPPLASTSCPAEMSTLIQGCWLQDPNFRYSFENVLEDLHDILPAR